MTQQERSMFNCPVEATLSLIGGKYKPIILWHLIKEPLHGLETSGMISREVIPEKPPRTIYSLTEFGKSIIPVLDVMCTWGTDYLNGLNVKTPCQKQERG